jgi:hypothetical protein
VRQSGAFLGFLKRISSCSIAAMRRFKSEHLETEITSARIDRSARSLTDSDSAPAASLAICSVARRALLGARLVGPRLLLAALAVLSPGPKLAGTPSGGGRMVEMCAAWPDPRQQCVFLRRGSEIHYNLSIFTKSIIRSILSPTMGAT